MSSCPRVLSQEDYRWRHDKVLGVIATRVLQSFQINQDEPNKKLMNFVRANKDKDITEEENVIPQFFTRLENIIRYRQATKIHSENNTK